MTLFSEACKYIPGGVNSPVRAFRGVGGEPIFFKKAAGAHTIAADGRRFIDYVGSWGPMILGHAHPRVIEAVQRVAADGLSFGAPTEFETQLARRVIELLPTVELVRFVSSGTEATMSAIRLARGFTGRDIIVKFEGCYHGHSDSLLIKAGSGALTLGVPTSPGVPKALADFTVTLDFNDGELVREAFRRLGDRIACVIVEPVAGNMNCVPPVPGFLDTLRRECDRSGALLIFDEVMTGFRVALGGAQALYGVRPDLTTLGKIIGGGMPVGAFGGRRDVMERLAPLGPVYQAGTLSGNPVAMASGITTLDILIRESGWERLEQIGAQVERALLPVLAAASFPIHFVRAGSLFWMSFHDAAAPRTAESMSPKALARYSALFHAMLDRGVYLPPSAYEACFLSLAHTSADVEQLTRALRESLAMIK